jgi:GR25 family glycosyltransferase involved in LPS biosynthesis
MTTFSTYVISLNYPNKLLETLSNHELEPILFKGINGKNLNQDTINKYFNRFYSLFGPKSAIGCALSHLKVWQTFLKTDSEYAIIFEDDIVFNNTHFVKNNIKLKDIIEFYISQTPNDFDILYLGSFGTESNFNFFTLTMNILNNTSKNKHINKFIRKSSVILSTHSYILSRSGAEKLVDYLNGHIHNHIDYCIQTLSSKNLIQRYITTPRIIFQTSTDNTISSNVSNSHPIIFNRILSKYYLDTNVKASYITTLSVFRLGNFNFTISTIILILITIISLIIKVPIYHIILFLILISLPEINQTFSNYNFIKSS